MDMNIRKTIKPVGRHRRNPILLVTLLVLAAGLTLLSSSESEAKVKPGKVSQFQVTTYKIDTELSKKESNEKKNIVALTWSQATNANKYQILYSYKKNGSYKKAVKKLIKGKEEATGHLSYKLAYKSNKIIFFKIIPYNGSTKGTASDWVGIKPGNPAVNASAIEINEGDAALYVGDKKSFSTSTEPKKPMIKDIRWYSSDTSIANVDSSGKVTAVKKGKAVIYAMAHNGVRNSVKITVKQVAAPASVTVSWGIWKSKISWKAVDGADGYELYSRVTKDGKDVKLASFDSDETSYTDTYYNANTGVSKSLGDSKYLFQGKYSLDPTVNPLIYFVKAIKKVDGQVKRSAAVEEFHLEPPTIIKASKPSNGKITLTWGRSMLADGYYIYRGKAGSDGKGKDWEKIAHVPKKANDKPSMIQYKKKVAYDSSMPYYAVRSYSYKNGKKISSKFDQTFHVDGRKYSGKKVLFLGSSITFGSPYTAQKDITNPYYAGESDGYVCTYPRRFYQLTHAKIANASLPGGTFTYINGEEYNPAYASNTTGHRCLTITSKQIAEAKKDVDSYGLLNAKKDFEIIESLKYGKGSVYKNSIDYEPTRASADRVPGKLSDYDVIVVVAGSNDAKRCIKTGKGMGTLSLSNKDNTNFTGSHNYLLSTIEDASDKRVAKGKAPTNIVFVDYLYRKSGDDPKKELMDEYQERTIEIENMWKEKWKATSDPNIYRFQHNYLTEENIDQLSSDYIHLTRYSHGQFGSMLANFMIKEGILTK